MSEGTHTPTDVRGRIIRASILPIEDEETMIAGLRAGAEAVERGELDVDDFVGIWSQYLRQLLRASSVHAPADVRERVAKEVYLWEATRFGAAESWALRRWREESNTRRKLYFNVADRILALLRAPRGEGEDSRLAPIVRAILERIDRYQAFHDRVGPADLTLPPVARTITEEEILALRAALRSEAQWDGPVGAVCANCGAPNAAIAGGELDPDEAVCSSECYDQLKELGCPQEHGGTYRPQPARRGEGGGDGG